MEPLGQAHPVTGGGVNCFPPGRPAPGGRFLGKLLVLVSLITLAVACGQAAERPVPVFASPDSPRLRQTLAGLEEGLAPRRLAVAVVPAVGESGPETLRRLRAAGPPLFVVLGTPALIMLAQVEKRIPALFAMVANPYFSDAAWDPKRPEFHSRNVTGLASPPPVAQALRQGTGLLGRRAWGLLYDPLDGAALEVARAFEAAAAELGLRSLMETSSEAGQDLEALERLRSRGAQVFYLPPTATASRYAPHLLAWGRQRRVLVVSGHPEVEPQGAILSVTLDYHALGREAAALARRLLAGESPAGIPIRETQPLAIQADHALIRHWSGYPAPLQGK